MKTTIDLPDDLLHRAKIVAAQRKTTLKEIVMLGLNLALQSDISKSRSPSAIKRLHKGLHLGGSPLTRSQAHERH